MSVARAQTSLDVPPREEEDAARENGLRYVSDTEPGIRRRRNGKGFFYLAPDGSRVTREDDLRRIRALVIPPAWTDVWICRSEKGHIQATGRDARGRKQYRYHDRWRAARDAAKYESLENFARCLPGLRRALAQDMASPGLSRRKVVASAVALIDATLIRVGNDEYVRSNGSYGLTTLRRRQVKVNGHEVSFVFNGKSGKEQRIGLRHRRVARIIRQCQDLPGQLLLKYVAEDGSLGHVSSDDVNDYLREATGAGFTAKTFRTWGASVLLAAELAQIGPPETATGAKRNVAGAVKSVAARLGNTATVCRQCYVHPAVIESYMDGTFPFAFLSRSRTAADPEKLSAEEKLLLRILENCR